MKISAIKAVIFDCDGVLFDTANANRRFYNILLHQFSRPELNQEQFENVHMMTVKEALFYLFPEMKEDMTPVYTGIQKIDYQGLVKDMQMADGLVPLLEQIHQNGMIRAVATNRTNSMGKVLTNFHLENMFEKVVTAMDVKHPKPAPDQLLLIMETFRLEPDQMIFIGDSQFDMEAAKSAGTGFAAFQNSSLCADLHVDSMQELGQSLQLR